MKLPPEINLIAVSHYLQALGYQRYSNQVVAMLGGKTPHIQNVAVGGVANAINLESEAALNVDRLFQMKSLLEKIVSFIQNVYVPDVCAIAGFYPDWFSYGAGVTNYLSVPDLPLDGKSTQFELPGGFIPTAISRSSSPSPARRTRPGAGPSPKTARTPGTKAAARCIRGKARPIRSPPSGTKTRSTPGSKPPATTASPRRSARSRMHSSATRRLVGYAQGNPLMKKWTDAALDKISAIAHVKATPAMLHSTLGRHGARAIRAACSGATAFTLKTRSSSSPRVRFQPRHRQRPELRGVVDEDVDACGARRQLLGDLGNVAGQIRGAELLRQLAQRLRTAAIENETVAALVQRPRKRATESLRGAR
jgi:hydrogenase large subunit